jgi:hypothetical protein
MGSLIGCFLKDFREPRSGCFSRSDQLEMKAPPTFLFSVIFLVAQGVTHSPIFFFFYLTKSTDGGKASNVLSWARLFRSVCLIII